MEQMLDTSQNEINKMQTTFIEFNNKSEEIRNKIKSTHKFIGYIKSMWKVYIMGKTAVYNLDVLNITEEDPKEKYDAILKAESYIKEFVKENNLSV